MDQGKLLVDALLYGNLQGLSEETIFLFSRTGLIHLFSASGFHLWAALQVADALAYPMLPFLKKSRHRDYLRFAVRLLLMIFFGNATNWSSPMVRAFVFVTLSSGSRLIEVQSNRHWVFLLSLVCSALLGKGGNLSFLLSACGMAGVLYVQPRKAWALALGPWLFTLPLTLFYFGTFPLLAPLWNLSFGIAISWLVLPLAILALLGNSLDLPVEILTNTAAWLMSAITKQLLFTANLAGLTYWVRPLPWIFLVVGILSAQWLWSKNRKSATACALSAFLMAYFWPSPSLAVLNVGQGDAILLRTQGAWVLNDFGPPGYRGFSAPVCQSLEALGIGNLDHLLLSHFDLDHRGGLSSLLARHPVSGNLWFREENLAGNNADLVLAAAERANVRIRFLASHSSPPPGIKCWYAPFFRGNDSSPLCRAELDGASKILLTGDMSQKAEEWFLHFLQPFPQAEFLKVAHHGSRSSSTTQFLQLSAARVAFISVGLRNRYHHPTQEALSRLERNKMRVRRTDKEGSLLAYPWRKYRSYLGSGALTEEIARPVSGMPLEYPGNPAPARRAYAEPAFVK